MCVCPSLSSVGLGVVRVGHKLAVYRQRLLLSFESLDIGTGSVEKMRTFDLGLGSSHWEKRGDGGDKQLQQCREKRERERERWERG